MVSQDADSSLALDLLSELNPVGGFDSVLSSTFILCLRLVVSSITIFLLLCYFFKVNEIGEV